MRVTQGKDQGSEVSGQHLSREALVVDLVFRACPITCSKQQPQFTEPVAVKEGTPRHIDHGPGCRQERHVAPGVVQGSPELWERRTQRSLSSRFHTYVFCFQPSLHPSAQFEHL